MSWPFYFVLESKHVLLETAGTVTNKARSEQTAPLRGHIQTQAKAAKSPSIRDKLNSAQEETLPEHEGERTG